MKETPESASPAEPGRAVASASRAAELLEAMQPVFGHDLPNQLVVVQSLIGLLELEDGTLSSAESHEIVSRLKNAAQRAGAMVFFLKDMARLARRAEPLEEVHLAGLAREILAELRQRFPGRPWNTTAQLGAVTVRAGRRSLQDAVVQLVCLALPENEDAEHLLQFRSRVASSGGAELAFEFARAGMDLPEARGARQDSPRLEHRLEMIMARALIAGWGGSLSVSPGLTLGFSISTPPQSRHA